MNGNTFEIRGVRRPKQMVAVGTVLPCAQFGVSRKDARRYAVEEVNQMGGNEVLR